MILSENVSGRASALGIAVVIFLACLALPTWSLGQTEDASGAGQSAIPLSSQNTGRDTGLETDRDTDGDGLPDFQEQHKYRTDPRKKDTDGDGVPDGDWEERREYTYTIRSIVRVMPPCGKGTLCDDYQDARIQKETEEYVELEVVHYPLATSGDAISQSKNWRQDHASMTEHLKPRTNANWDKKMRSDLLAELHEAGIRVDVLSDKQVAEKVSDWFVNKYKPMPLFNALHVHYPKGRIAVIPGREGAIDLGRDDWTLQDGFEHELLGRSMFYHKTRGTCTSSAMGLTTVLRAVGIPTRMVLAIPIVDASDEKQVAMVRNLKHHKVRETVLEGVLPLGGAFASHTFNEVYIGGHWRRLNYNRLGQPILDKHMFGLVTHIHTFNDLSEWGLQPTWGKWNASRRKTAVFAHNNPYATLALSDQFGQHAQEPNPPVEKTRASQSKIRQFTISKAYWFHSNDRPQWIPADRIKQDGAGHLLVHVDEKFDGAGFLNLYRSIGKKFTLKAQGKPDMPARAELGYWANEFYLRIPEEDFTNMAASALYKLVAADAKWKVKPDVTIVKKRPAAAPINAADRLTIGQPVWFHSPNRPKSIRETEAPKDGGGHLLLCMETDIDRQLLAKLYRKVDKQFVLVAQGGRQVLLAQAERGYWGTKRGIDFYFRIHPKDYAKMTEGVEYKLVAANREGDVEWSVEPGVTIVKNK